MNYLSTHTSFQCTQTHSDIQDQLVYQYNFLSHNGYLYKLQSKKIIQVPFRKFGKLELKLLWCHAANILDHKEVLNINTILKNNCDKIHSRQTESLLLKTNYV